MKTQITQNQVDQFNRMRETLIRIHRQYMTVDQIRMDQEFEGLDFEEYISMAYENIQEDAKAAVKGVKQINVTPS